MCGAAGDGGVGANDETWSRASSFVATKLASMQKLHITTDTLISVYDVTHLKIKET